MNNETTATTPIPSAEAQEGGQPYLARFTPGPWVWHTSNSWKRLKRDGHGMTMNVLEPFVHWRDHHPDCTVSEEDMALIAAAPDLYGALTKVSEMLFRRPDMLAALHPLMGPAEHAVFDAAAAALAKASPATVAADNGTPPKTDETKGGTP